VNKKPKSKPVVAKSNKTDAILKEHKKLVVSQEAVQRAAMGGAQPVTVVPPINLVRYDLACGQSPKEGFIGVDLHAPNPDLRFDLTKFPWPLKDHSVDELHCSHYVEHIPCREVEERDLVAGGEAPTEVKKSFLGKDHLFAFFDECWRILKPGSKMLVIVPCGRSNRAFQDPTHRRFIVVELFFYLNHVWRAGNKLDHYRVNCNFGFSVQPTVAQHMALLSDEARQNAFDKDWNAIHDFWVTLEALPPPAKGEALPVLPPNLPTP
jgi:predicted SAM-dependent methyltransferase